MYGIISCTIISMFCCATANLLQQLICRRGIQPIRPSAPRLVSRVWPPHGAPRLAGTPNTPRQAINQLPGTPRLAVASYAVLDSHCLVGRAKQPIGRRKTSRRALAPPGWPRAWSPPDTARRAMQPLPARPRRRQCKLARARVYTSTILCSGSILL